MSGRPGMICGRWLNYDAESINYNRKNAILQMIAERGEVTRTILRQEMGLAECTISGLVNQCIAEGTVVDLKCKFGEGGSKAHILKLPSVEPRKNRFEGWNGAPALGLEGWESVVPQQTNIIHLTSYST